MDVNMGQKSRSLARRPASVADRVHGGRRSSSGIRDPERLRDLSELVAVGF